MNTTGFIKYVFVFGVLKLGFIGGILGGGIVLFALHRFSLQSTLEFLDGKEAKLFFSALAIGVFSATLTYFGEWLRKGKKPNAR